MMMKCIICGKEHDIFVPIETHVQSWYDTGGDVARALYLRLELRAEYKEDFPLFVCPPCYNELLETAKRDVAMWVELEKAERQRDKNRRIAELEAELARLKKQ